MSGNSVIQAGQAGQAGQAARAIRIPRDFETRAAGQAGWPMPALVAVAIGLAAACGATLAGPFATVIGAAAIVLAYGRGRGWPIARALERPRFFGALAGCYLPIFLIDFTIAALWSNLVAALVRLIVFLTVAELLSGTMTRTHRPILLGLLLLVAAASETTDVWFAVPLLGFALAAVSAQMRATMIEAQPPGAGEAPKVRALPVVALVAGSLALGGILFLAIPRVGIGWGRSVRQSGTEQTLETGMADSVRLGVVGQVKKRSRVAFTARLRGSYVGPEAIYWRGRAYTRWTGDGWIKGDEDDYPIDLPGGKSVAMPGATIESSVKTLEASIEMKLEQPSFLPSPGRPLWVRTSWFSRVRVTPDGSLIAPSQRAPRRYEVGVSPLPTALPSVERAGLPSAAPAEPGLPEHRFAAELDSGRLEPAVRRWAERIAPDETDPRRLARAFVDDLERRPYSLDTRGIDPGHPLRSFLEGAPAHCEYFASAMAMGLRQRGVPARTVGGYIGSDRVPFSETLIVRESRAHLWVEAYLPGQGWTTFDPTPAEGRAAPSELGYLARGTWERIVLTWDSMVIGLDIGDQADLLLGAKAFAIGLWDQVRRPIVLAAGALLLAAIGGYFAWRRTLARRTGAATPAPAPAYYRSFLKEASRRGLVPAEAETSREFASRAVSVLSDHDAVWVISLSYERERFGGAPPGAAERAALDRALGRLRNNIPCPS